MKDTIVALLNGDCLKQFIELERPNNEILFYIGMAYSVEAENKVTLRNTPESKLMAEDFVAKNILSNLHETNEGHLRSDVESFITTVVRMDFEEGDLKAEELNNGTVMYIFTREPEGMQPKSNAMIEHCQERIKFEKMETARKGLQETVERIAKEKNMDSADVLKELLSSDDVANLINGK